MDFDFQSKYAGYNNTQLLLILQNRDQYQPAAVAAAEIILATRTITQQELDEVMPATAQPAATTAARQPWREGMSIFDESEEGLHQIREARNWKIAVAVAIGFQVVLQGASTVILLIDSFAYSLRLFRNAYQILELILLMVMIPGLMLFLKQRRNGWIILTGYAVFSMLMFLCSLSISVIRFGRMRQIQYPVILILLNAGAAYLLMLGSVRRSYDIDPMTAKRVTGITGVASLLYIAITMVLAI